MGKNVGVVGIGKVGSRIAGSLRAGGHAVVAFDQAGIDKEVQDRLSLKVVGSCRELGDIAETVLLSLPNSAAVRTVVVGEEGLLPSGAAVKTIVDTSTISPHTAVNLAALCAEQGVQFIDSPITGGLVGAEAGQLNLLLGGDGAAITAIEDVLGSIAVTWHHMGPSGTGQAAKLTHNLIGQALVVLFSEAMVIGTSQGLEPRAVYETLRNHTKVYDYCLDKFLARGLSGDFSPRFTLDMAHKDLTELLEVAHAERLPMMLTSLVREVHEMGRAMGMGAEDNTAILRIYETMLGRTMRVGSA